MRTMLRTALVLLTLSTACAHAPQGADPISLRRETVPEDKSELSFELFY